MQPDFRHSKRVPVDEVWVVEAEQVACYQLPAQATGRMLKELALNDQVILLSDHESGPILHGMRSQRYSFRKLNSILVIWNTSPPAVDGKPWMDSVKAPAAPATQKTVVRLLDGRMNAELLTWVKVVGDPLGEVHQSLNQPAIEALLSLLPPERK